MVTLNLSIHQAPDSLNHGGVLLPKPWFWPLAAHVCDSDVGTGERSQSHGLPDDGPAAGIPGAVYFLRGSHTLSALAYSCLDGCRQLGGGVPVVGDERPAIEINKKFLSDVWA